MTKLVPSSEIEGIVGAPRDRRLHLGRFNSTEGMVYILHPHWCLDEGDLRDCPWSLALDNGIELSEWDGFYDAPVVLTAGGSRGDERLVPIGLFIQ